MNAVAQLIGRERELGALVEATGAEPAGARGVLLEGEAGVGKTVLWRMAVDRARERGWRVVETAPTRSEGRLAFAALGDLLDLEVDAVLPRLPEPQRIALEVALLRRPDVSGSAGAEGRMIAVATLAVLRLLAAHSPLVVAIDDLQWVDAASAAALLFALRRLRDEPVLVLATRRLERPGTKDPELARLVQDERLSAIRVEPLSLGAVHELLRSRLGLDVSRRTLVRLHELVGGNPFFALEIGRELIARGGEPAADEPLPVPGGVRDVVGARFERLSPPARDVLLAAAALARPTRSLLARLGPAADSALDEAAAAGLIELSGGERIRFAHPLLASIHYEQSALAERRRVHTRLSEIVEDLEERARHMALGTREPDEGVAAQLDAAARSAGLRGSPHAAAELSDLAARLTPAPPGRALRLLASAEHHREAGDLELATDRAREALRLHATSEVRARALSVLGTVTGDGQGIETGREFYRQALREPGASRELRADVHHKLTWLCLVGADARTARRHAHAMARLAAGTAAEASAAATLSHVVVVGGEPVPRELLKQVKTLRRAAEGNRPWAWSETSPVVLEGVVLLWGGEVEEAQGPLRQTLQAATEQGNPWLEMHALAYLSSVETALGRPRLGWELARRYLTLADSVGQDAHRSGALWPVAVAAGWLGRLEEARDAAREGLGLAQRLGQGLYVIGNLSALGAVELSQGDDSAAAETLLRAWQLADRGGIASPARFAVLSDAVEALTACRQDEPAGHLAARHLQIARRLDRPWALALAARCEALVAEARGEDERASEAFERALAQHERQPRPLDRGRTLLAYGRQQRRRQRKGAARELLEQALVIFEAAETAAWAARTRVELGRIGGRRAPSGDRMSASESAIAELVAAGRTNREIGGTLHLSARTVEWNLSKIYRKLGVRSRTELATALAGRAPELAHPQGGKSRDTPG